MPGEARLYVILPISPGSSLLLHLAKIRHFGQVEACFSSYISSSSSRRIKVCTEGEKYDYYFYRSQGNDCPGYGSCC